MIRLINSILLSLFVIFTLSCSKPTDNEFYLAVTGKDTDLVKEYFKKGYIVNEKSGNPLEAAIENDDILMISLLVENGVSPNILYQNSSLLQWAIRKGDIKLIDLLIKNGADVNFVDPNGYSVFSIAISKLPDENLTIFIKNGLDLMGRSKSNNKNISYFKDLILNNKLKTASLFLDDPNVVNEAINDPDIIFTLFQRWGPEVKEMADKLIEKGYKLDHELPLLQHTTGNYDATLWLLDRGVSPLSESKNPEDLTPLDSAYFALYMLTKFDKEEGYSADDEEKNELEERKKVIELLKERIKMETQKQGG